MLFFPPDIHADIFTKKTPLSCFWWFSLLWYLIFLVMSLPSQKLEISNLQSKADFFKTKF